MRRIYYSLNFFIDVADDADVDTSAVDGSLTVMVDHQPYPVDPTTATLEPWDERDPEED